MPPQRFDELCAQRTSRAHALADRFPEARDPLLFYGALASLQRELNDESAVASMRAFVLERGPGLLKDAAESLSEGSLGRAVEAYRTGADRKSPASFFARCWLQARSRDREERCGAIGHGEMSLCPECFHPPQVGVLRSFGDGTSTFLACGLCFVEWSSARARCPYCGRRDDSIVYFGTAEIGAVRVQACDGCKRYLHFVDLDQEPDAVPDVDEIAALALDVWATDAGFRKVFPNLVGM